MTGLAQLQKERLFKKTTSFAEQRLALIFIAPTLLTLLVLVGWPVLHSLFLSFHRVVVAGGSMHYEAVGLDNYLALFKDDHFQQALGQTAIYTVIRVTAVMVISLVLAQVLNQAVAGVQLFKRLFLLPWAMSYIVNALMWGWIFHGNFGLANALLQKLGVIDQYQIWLANPRQALGTIIFASIWKAIPFAALMTLAALQTIPKELMDAAKVDGAGVWARFIHVTLPWIKPVTLVLLVIETMWALKTFDIIWVLTEGGPLNRTMVLNIFAYQQAFKFGHFGYGSAAAYVVTALIMGMTIAYVVLLKGLEE